MDYSSPLTAVFVNNENSNQTPRLNPNQPPFQNPIKPLQNHSPNSDNPKSPYRALQT